MRLYLYLCSVQSQLKSFVSDLWRCGGPLAQSVERRADNAKVVSSRLTWTILFSFSSNSHGPFFFLQPHLTFPYFLSKKKESYTACYLIYFTVALCKKTETRNWTRCVMYITVQSLL